MIFCFGITVASDPHSLPRDIAFSFWVIVLKLFSDLKEVSLHPLAQHHLQLKVKHEHTIIVYTVT